MVNGENDDQVKYWPFRVWEAWKALKGVEGVGDDGSLFSCLQRLGETASRRHGVGFGQGGPGAFDVSGKKN